MDNINLFYKDDGTVINRSDVEQLQLLPLGDYGRVYRYDDKVIKILNNPGTIMQYKVVSTIKNLKLSNFYEIYDVLSCENTKCKSFAGTISKYYEGTIADVLTTPSDYLLDSYYHLSNSFYTLGQNGIAVSDFYSNNCILTENGITVIDVDLYSKYDDINEDGLARVSHGNLFKLKYLFFLDLFMRHFFSFHQDEFSSKDISSIFASFIGDNKFDDNDDTFGYNLYSYKYPIDYVKKKLK